MPRVREVLKSRQDNLKFFNTSTALHISFLFCFVFGIIIGISVGSVGAFFIFYIVGAFLEGLASGYWDWNLNQPHGYWGRPEFDSSMFLEGCIFAPLWFFWFLSAYSSSKINIDDRYKSDLEGVSKIEGFW